MNLALINVRHARDLTPLVAAGIVQLPIGEIEFSSKAVQLLLLALQCEQLVHSPPHASRTHRLQPALIKPGPIASPFHVGELEVLHLDVLLYTLYLVDGLLRRVGLERELLVHSRCSIQSCE